jgi:hypothetical protein
MTEAISSVQQLEDAVAAVLPNDPKAELFFTRSVCCVRFVAWIMAVKGHAPAQVPAGMVCECSAWLLCRARDIVSSGGVQDVTVNSTTKKIAAKVSSVSQAWKQQYTVTCCLSSISAADPRFINSCSCPQHELTGICKHSIALALTQLLPGAFETLDLGCCSPTRWQCLQ